MSQATKVCVLCGADCAGKPRVKDGRGRYYCKRCHEDALANQRMLSGDLKPPKAAPPEAPPPAVPSLDDGLVGFADDDDAFAAVGAPGGGGGGGGDAIDALTQLLPTSGPAPGVGCPSCGKAVPPNAVVCINCGHDFHSGGIRTVSVSKDRWSMSRDKLGGGKLTPGWLFVILTGLIGGLAAVGAFAAMPKLALTAIVLCMIVGMVMSLWLLIASFMDSVWQGLGCLFVPFYALYWILGRNENGHLKALFGVYIVGWGLSLGLLFVGDRPAFVDDYFRIMDEAQQMRR